MNRIYDEERATYSLPLEPRTTMYGCGIYEAGHENSAALFVTDAGRVIPVRGRVITADDLMTAYTWGRQEEQEARELEEEIQREIRERP